MFHDAQVGQPQVRSHFPEPTPHAGEDLDELVSLLRLVVALPDVSRMSPVGVVKGSEGWTTLGPTCIALVDL